MDGPGVRRLAFTTWILAALGLPAFPGGCAESPPAQPASAPVGGGLSPLRNSLQVVLVISDDWDAAVGEAAAE